MKRGIISIIITSLLLVFGLAGFGFATTTAVTSTTSSSTAVDPELEARRAEIEAALSIQNEELKELDDQIAADRAKLEELEGEKYTLNKAVLNLSYSQNQLKKDILVTSSKVEATEEEIVYLQTEIDKLHDEIDQHKAFIGRTVQVLDRQEQLNFWETALNFDTFSEFFERVGTLEKMNDLLRQRTTSLTADRDSLSNKNFQRLETKQKLEWQQQELADKKKIVDITKSQKTSLLTQTRNTEKIYEQSLQTKLDLKRQFEEALFELESRLQVTLDDGVLPDDREGLFSWPVGNFRITQFFGHTDFAKSGAYNGRGHSGIDFAVPTGTPVRAVMDGTVTGVGNTDAFRGCVSYGKWFLIDHGNGLSTLGAHNSLIKVKPGQQIKRGDLVAYSGNSGYSTGPHLHFSTYATKGVTVRNFGEATGRGGNCAKADIPIIAGNAYLDPFAYLPRPKFNVGQAKFGDNNATVRSIQKMLKHLRIFPLEVSTNGQYGPTTADAVLVWQQKNNISEGGDGETFGPLSVELYNSFFK